MKLERGRRLKKKREFLESCLVAGSDSAVIGEVEGIGSELNFPPQYVDSGVLWRMSL